MPRPQKVIAFAVTVYNYTQTTVDDLKNIHLIKYAIFHEKRQKHSTSLHGYVHINKPKTAWQLHKILKSEGFRCWVSIAKGTLQTNQKQWKKHGYWEDWGAPTKQQVKSDTSQLYNMVMHGKSNLEICMQFPDAYIKHWKAVAHIRQVLDKNQEDIIMGDREINIQKDILKKKLEKMKATIFWIVDKNGTKWTTKEHINAQGLMLTAKPPAFLDPNFLSIKQ